MLNLDLRQFAGRAGQLAGRALQNISQFERGVSRFDRQTGGVLGDIYRMSPAAPLYSQFAAPAKLALRTAERIGTATQQKGAGVLAKAALDVVQRDEPLLRPAGMAENPIFRVAQSPALMKYTY